MVIGKLIASEAVIYISRHGWSWDGRGCATMSGIKESSTASGERLYGAGPLQPFHTALSTFSDHGTSQESAVRAGVRLIHTNKKLYVKRRRQVMHSIREGTDARKALHM